MLHSGENHTTPDVTEGNGFSAVSHLRDDGAAHKVIQLQQLNPVFSWDSCQMILRFDPASARDFTEKHGPSFFLSATPCL